MNNVLWVLPIICIQTLITNHQLVWRLNVTLFILPSLSWLNEFAFIVSCWLGCNLSMRCMRSEWMVTLFVMKVDMSKSSLTWPLWCSCKYTTICSIQSRQASFRRIWFNCCHGCRCHNMINPLNQHALMWAFLFQHANCITHDEHSHCSKILICNHQRPILEIFKYFPLKWHWPVPNKVASPPSSPITDEQDLHPSLSQRLWTPCSKMNVFGLMWMVEESPSMWLDAIWFFAITLSSFHVMPW